MRILLVVWLASTAASAAELKGRVVFHGAPVSQAEVRVFAARTELEGCAQLDGQGLFGPCLCPAGQAAFGARLLAGLKLPGRLASTVSGADGTFSISVAAPGPWIAVAISADGTLAGQAPVAEEGSELTLSDSVRTKFKLAGRSEGAVAWLFDLYTLAPTALTQSNGEWSSGPMPAGMSYLLVTSPGSQVVRVMVQNGRFTHLIPTLHAETPMLTLSPPRSISGTVVDERGRPVAGAEVIADPDQCAVKTQTNPKGEFTVPAVSAAPYLTVLLARAAGKVSRAHGEGGARVELPLRKAAQLALSFSDPQGQPVEGVSVRLRGQHVRNRAQKSDRGGKWSEQDLYEEEVGIAVEAPWILLGERTVALKGSTKKALVVERGVLLAGRVVDARGAAVPSLPLSIFYGDALQARVTESMKEALREGGAFTDARGEFTFSVLPGEYEVVAKRDQPGESAALGTAPGRVELKLAAPLAITGTVVDPAGKPIAGAHLSFRRSDVPNYSWGAQSDARGQFELAVKAPGTFEVTVTRGTGGATKQLTVELGSAGAAPLKVQLEAVTLLRGTVVDPAGKPLGNVRVEAVPMSFPQLMMGRMQRQPVDPGSVLPMAKMMHMSFPALTAADGTFELPTAMEAMVFVQLEGFGADPVIAAAGKPAKLVVGPRSVARGRVVGPSGRPVTLFHLNGQQFEDSEGRFTVTLPASGTLPLRIEAAQAPLETRAIEVPPTVGTVELGELKLRQGFVVSGHVFSAQTGKPVKGVFLAGTSKAGDIRATAVQPDGSFTYSGVPEGPFELVVSSNDHAATARTVKAGDRNVEIRLQRFASLTVRARRNREPAKGDVKVVGPSIGEASNVRHGSLDPDGELKLRQLQPGEWTVQVGAGPAKKVVLKPDQQGTVELDLP